MPIQLFSGCCGWDVQSLFGEPFTKPCRRGETVLKPLSTHSLEQIHSREAERRCGHHSSVPTAPNFLWTWQLLVVDPDLGPRPGDRRGQGCER